MKQEEMKRRRKQTQEGFPIQLLQMEAVLELGCRAHSLEGLVVVARPLDHPIGGFRGGTRIQAWC